MESQPGSLTVIRAEHVANLPRRLFLELVDALGTCTARDRNHKNILACDCFGRAAGQSSAPRVMRAV